MTNAFLFTDLQWRELFYYFWIHLKINKTKFIDIKKNIMVNPYKDSIGVTYNIML